MQKGFTLVMAIIFLVIVATLGIMALDFGNRSVKQSTDVFLKEQAELLATSAQEFAVMSMQMHDYTKNCLNKITIFYPSKSNYILRADVKLRYFDASLKCENTLPGGFVFADVGGLRHPSKYTAVIEVTVSGQQSAGTDHIKYFSKTVQKP